MKAPEYTEIICRGFCSFFREGKDELACRTYSFLAERFSPGDLSALIKDIIRTPDLSRDRELRDLVCERCEFLIDGCDFREGVEAPPCGGYTIIEWLLKKDRLGSR